MAKARIIGKVERFQIECSACGFIWTSRVGRPVECAKCHRYLEYDEGEVEANAD